METSERTPAASSGNAVPVRSSAVALDRPAGRSSVLPDMLSLLSTGNVLSLALGLPDPALFPVADWMHAATRVAARGPRAFQYGASEPRLKGQIRELMARRGVQCREDQILVTAGAQQGLHLLARLLLRMDRTAVVEEFTYPNFCEVLRQQGVRAMVVPTRAATGLDVTALEDLLDGSRQRTFLYVMPDGHNPLGVSLRQEDRARLVDLARRHHMPIIEDDTYGFLYYDSPLPPLRALDDEWVFYTGSLSKILAPALRIGWVVVPSRFLPALALLKEASDINTATFDQRVTSAYLDTASFPDHLVRLRTEYRRRRDVLLDAVQRAFPPGARCTKPGSGFFVWLELPPIIDTTDLLRAAIEQEQVAFIPGEACRPISDGRGTNCLRLNFSHPDPESIRDGIGRLARAVESLAARV